MHIHIHYYSCNIALDCINWFKNIILTEGNGHTFTLNLEGVQNLKQGVYLYSSEIREDTSSQTLVGMANGKREFDVSMSISFDLDVDEGVVATEHIWRNEYDPVIPPEEPPMPVDEDPVPFRLGNDDTVIEEEPVPLAAPVATGDNAVLWIAVIMMAMFAIVIINFPAKKRENESF